MGMRRVMAALAGALLISGGLAQDVAAQPRGDGDRRFERERDDRRDDWREERRDDRRDDRRFDRDWLLLGEKEVGFRVDRDEVVIGQSEDWYRTRSFRTLHFLAEGNDVHMMSVRLVYFNGYGEDLRLDRLIRRGEDLPLDLRGERSYLRRVEMVYRARPDFGGRAIIKVYGEPALRGPPGPPPLPPPVVSRAEWVELGCQQVALVGRDRDTIPVGRREGRFKSVRLHVRGADVEVLELTVVYTNGEPDRIPVKHLLRAGERTQPISLKGWERSIDRVEMAFRTALNPIDIIAKQRISTANVCIEGLQ